MLHNKNNLTNINDNDLSKIWYGKARAEDSLAEKLKSNEMLNQAIVAYTKAVDYGANLPDSVFKMIAQRCLERMKFIGKQINQKLKSII